MPRWAEPSPTCFVLVLDVKARDDAVPVESLGPAQVHAPCLHLSDFQLWGVRGLWGVTGEGDRGEDGSRELGLLPTLCRDQGICAGQTGGTRVSLRALSPGVPARQHADGGAWQQGSEAEAGALGPCSVPFSSSAPFGGTPHSRWPASLHAELPGFPSSLSFLTPPPGSGPTDPGPPLLGATVCSTGASAITDLAVCSGLERSYHTTLGRRESGLRLFPRAVSCHLPWVWSVPHS